VSLGAAASVSGVGSSMVEKISSAVCLGGRNIGGVP